MNCTDREKKMQVVRTAPDANHIVAVSACRADVVIMDISMSGLNGFEATRCLIEKISNISVILVSVYDVNEYREAAFSVGAKDYLIKKNIMNELILAIRKVKT